MWRLSLDGDKRDATMPPWIFAVLSLQVDAFHFAQKRFILRICPEQYHTGAVL